MWFRSIRSLSTATTSLITKEIYQGNSVVRIVLNDTKRRNALSLAMIEELTKELQGINTIQKIRSVIIAAEGPAFSSGHNLKELRTSEGSDHHQKIFDRCGSLLQFIQRMEIPVIAEVNGIAAAAGCQLVASCDIAVCGESSTFMVPGQKVGLFCSTPGIPLARSVPRKVAMDMLLTGQPLDAQGALRAGLVSRVVADDQVRIEALKVAEQIGQFSRSVTSLGKGFFYAQTELSPSDAYRYGGKVMVGNLQLKDAQEGISAFVEKRSPTFGHSNEKAE